MSGSREIGQYLARSPDFSVRVILATFHTCGNGLRKDRFKMLARHSQIYDVHL